MTSKNLLHEKIAKKLYEDVKLSKSENLPSINKLSIKYEVGYVTMRKAVQSLVRKNILKCSRGKPILIVKNKSTETSSNQYENLSNSAKLFYKNLRLEILSGKKKISEQLSKFSHIAATEHISTQTIANVFNLLEKENLIHKNGKKWIVGTKPNNTISVMNNSSKKVIVSICTDKYEWDLYWTDPFVISFAFGNSFYSVCENTDIKIIHVFLNYEINSKTFIVGENQILEYIRSLGNRYIGSLILTTSHRTPLKFDFLQSILYFKKPVVLLNSGNRDIRFERKYLKYGHNYAYGEYEKNDSISLAFKILSELGHKTIGIPYAYFKQPNYYHWIKKRVNSMKKVLNETKYFSKIIFQEQKDLFWYNNKWIKNEDEFNKYFIGIMETVKKDLTSDKNNLISQKNILEKISPSLYSLTQNKNITAIIAQDSYLARLYLNWFNQMGISIPKDLSILTFDNDLRSRYTEISTIDRGLNSLGYKAAHFIIGDITVKTKRSGEILYSPFLVDRGSISSI